MTPKLDRVLQKRLRRQIADLNSPYRYVLARPFGGGKHGSKRFLSVYLADSDTYLMWNVGNKGVYPHRITLFKRRWLAQLVRDDLARRRPKIDRGMQVVRVRVDSAGLLISNSLRLP